jgi:hypothetical protein
MVSRPSSPFSARNLHYLSAAARAEKAERERDELLAENDELEWALNQWDYERRR